MRNSRAKIIPMRSICPRWSHSGSGTPVRARSTSQADSRALPPTPAETAIGWRFLCGKMTKSKVREGNPGRVLGHEGPARAAGSAPLPGYGQPRQEALTILPRSLVLEKGSPRGAPSSAIHPAFFQPLQGSNMQNKVPAEFHKERKICTERDTDRAGHVGTGGSSAKLLACTDLHQIPALHGAPGPRS